MSSASEIHRLKEEIARIEGRTRRFSSLAEGTEKAWTFGLPSIDGGLPEEGLAMAALHDFFPGRKADISAVSAFLLRLVLRVPRSGPVVWCQAPFETREHGRIHAPGLLGLGLEPERVVAVSLPHPRHMGFVLEEALGLTAVAAVIGEGDGSISPRHAGCR